MVEVSMDHPFLDNDEWSGDRAEEPRHQRRWPVFVVSILVVVIAPGAVAYVAASHYQPLSQSFGGGYGSQVLTSNGALAQVTGVGGPHVAWTEPNGSFRVEVVFSINNDQRFGVTIDKVLAPANPSGTSKVRVYFDSKPHEEGVYGLKGGPAFRPTTLASKGQLELAIHWVQQCVPTSASSNATTYRSLPVEFTFLGFHHTVNVPIQSLTIAPRTTC